MTKRIILAGAERAISGLLTHLEDEGLAVTAALDGRQTLEFVERQSPDLPILDLDMPGSEGRDIVRVLHERELMLFPILVFIGSTDHRTIDRQGDAVARTATNLDRVVLLAKRLLGDVVHSEPEAAVAGSAPAPSGSASPQRR